MFCEYAFLIVRSDALEALTLIASQNHLSFLVLSIAGQTFYLSRTQAAPDSEFYRPQGLMLLGSYVNPLAYYFISFAVSRSLRRGFLLSEQLRLSWRHTSVI